MAFRYLRARRRERFISVITLISLIGIMLGVATLIVVMSVMNGFRAELIDRILGINGHIVIEPVDTPLDDYDAVATAVAGVEGVEGRGAAGREGSAGKRRQWRDRRPDPRRPRAGFVVDSRALRTTSCSARSRPLTPRRAWRSASAWPQTLGVCVGDDVTLISPDGPVTPMGQVPAERTFKVVAIFQIGMSEYDSDLHLHAVRHSAGLLRPGQ